MHTSEFIIQGSTPHSEHKAMLSCCPQGPFSLRKISEFCFVFLFFLENMISDRTSHLAILITSPAQCRLPHSALANPSESDVSSGERRPLKCQTILLAPSSIPSAGLRRRLFLTGGTCPCISSLIHEGGGRRGRGVTQKQLSCLRTATYL